MKWTGGPVVARAILSGLRQFENATPMELRTAVTGYALHDLDAYWTSLPPRFHALAIYLKDEEWLNDALLIKGRPNRSSWVVLSGSRERERWFTETAERRESIRDPRGSRVAGPSLRFSVFRRDSFTCQYCGRRAPEFPLHVDHVVPWAAGGATTLSNLRTACGECNLGKGRGSDVA